MSDEVKSDKRRFFADLRKVEIVRNGKRMRWNEKSKTFVEVHDKDDKKEMKT